MAFAESPQARLVWERPEGLAGVAGSLFLDFPTHGLPREEAMRPPPLSLYDRARAQLLRLKVSHLGGVCRRCVYCIQMCVLHTGVLWIRVL